MYGIEYEPVTEEKDLHDEKDFPKIFKREWLNKDNGTAYIMVEASAGCYRDTVSIEASVEIKDCNRQIYLDFYAHSEEERQKRLTKLDLLINTLSELRSYVATAKIIEAKKN